MNLLWSGIYIYWQDEAAQTRVFEKSKQKTIEKRKNSVNKWILILSRYLVNQKKKVFEVYRMNIPPAIREL